MEQGKNEISDLPRFSAGKAVYILIKQIKELSSALSTILPDTILENLGEFITQYPQNSVTSILNSLANSPNFSEFLTKIGSSPMPKLNKKVLDEYFEISDYIRSIADLNQITIFQLENIENFCELCEFLDSKIELEEFVYSLSGIIVKKNNMFGVITKDVSGLIYNKIYSHENFETWGEALYSAFEGDFLPSFIIFVRKAKNKEQDEFIFMQETTMDSIRSMHQYLKYRIKSVNNDEKISRVENSIKFTAEHLIPNEKNAMRVLESLSNS